MFSTEQEYAHRLLAELKERNIQLVCLAGYLKKLPASVVSEFAGRMLNIHPAPLPRFGGPGMYGHHVHEAVLQSGSSESGPTVHFVDQNYDTGPVVAHVPVAVLPSDTPETLAARVLETEHKLYPRAVAAVAGGKIRLINGRVEGRLDAR